MSKPDFQVMTRQQLHEYVLTHREDQDVFYAYVDRLHAEATWIEMPPIDSIEELNNYPQFVERFRGTAET